MKELIRDRVLSDERPFGAVGDMVAEVLRVHGVDQDVTAMARRFTQIVCENSARHGYEGDTAQPIGVSVEARGHWLTVAVEDKGLPLDFQSLQKGSDRAVASILDEQTALTFRSLGQRGNRVELVTEVEADDIRTERRPAHLMGSVLADAVTEIRPMRPDEAGELARLVYRCYGYTYAQEFVYFPERVAARIRDGVMYSAVAVDAEGSIVGHLAMTPSEIGSRLALTGQAVVDPRYRGHHLFERLKLFLREQAGAHGIEGLYSEALTVHPYSQKGDLALGAHEVGFFLGYSPASEELRGGTEDASRRHAIALMLLPSMPTASRDVYAPAVYHEMLTDLYEANALERYLAYAIPE